MLLAVEQVPAHHAGHGVHLFRVEERADGRVVPFEEARPALRLALSEKRSGEALDRLLADKDFNDDTKDAGEMGSGHTVTAFYELVPAGSGTGGSGPSVPPADPLAFQQQTLVPSDDLAVFKLRYKKPGDGGEASILVTDRLSEKALLVPESNLDEDFRFASAVVEFGMLLRDSPYKAQASYQALFERARQAKGLDLEGYRAEFVRIVEMAEILDRD